MAFEITPERARVSAVWSGPFSRGLIVGAWIVLIGTATVLGATMVTSARPGGEPLESVGRPSTCEGVSIVGRGEYRANGTTHPMRNVTVDAFEIEESSQRDWLGRTRTDDHGRFSFCVDAGHASESGTIEVYVTIRARNPAAFATDSNGNRYQLSSGIAHATNGETVRIGSDTDGDGHVELVPNHRNPAWQAIDWALTEYRYIQANANVTRDRIQVKWPSGEWPTYHTNYDNAAIGSNDFINLPNRSQVFWGKKTVLHEYAHAVSGAMYDSGKGRIPRGTYGGHCVFSETDPGYALVEGWAYFLTATVSESPEAVSSLLGGNIETNQWYDLNTSVTACPNSDSGDMDGASVEGSVGSILYDIVDSKEEDDDGLAAGLSSVFEVFHRHHPRDIRDIYSNLSVENRDALDAIFTTYGIDKRPPSLAITRTKTRSTGSGLRLHLTGSTTDTHSDVRSVSVRIDGGEWSNATVRNGTWRFETSNVTRGTHAVHVEVADAYGNTRVIDRSIRVDPRESRSSPLTVSLESGRIEGAGEHRLTFVVTNTGSNPAHDIELAVTGLPTGWEPRSRDQGSGNRTATWALNGTLAPDERVHATGTFLVPNGTAPGEYDLQVAARARDNTTTTSVTVTVHNEGATAVEAIAGADSRIQFEEVLEAIRLFNEGEAATNGERVTFSQVLEIIELFNTGEPVNG